MPSADILVELGRLKTVGGQEDMIADLALNLSPREERQDERHANGGVTGPRCNVPLRSHARALVR